MTMLRLFVLRSENDSKALYGFLRANWNAMAQAGRPLSVSVAEYKSKRSDDQNRKLHAMLNELATNAWINGKQFTPDTWKEFVRQKFIGTEEIDMPDGRRIERGISTTTLSVQEFSELIEQINEWAASELGVILT